MSEGHKYLISTSQHVPQLRHRVCTINIRTIITLRKIIQRDTVHKLGKYVHDVGTCL